jgi:hypothetical protein
MQHQHVELGGEPQHIGSEREPDASIGLIRLIGVSAVATAVPEPRGPEPVTATSRMNQPPVTAAPLRIRRLQDNEPKQHHTNVHVGAPSEQLVLDLRWPGPSPHGNRGERTEPTATLITKRFLVSVLEALSGRRPLRQLQGQLDPTVYAALSTRISREPNVMQGIRLRSVHVCQPADDVIVACATLLRQNCAQALVARLENRNHGWLCTLLRLV